MCNAAASTHLLNINDTPVLGGAPDIFIQCSELSQAGKGENYDPHFKDEETEAYGYQLAHQLDQMLQPPNPSHQDDSI